MSTWVRWSLLLVIFMIPRVQAGERTVKDFSLDFSGNALDSTSISVRFGDSLKIDTAGTIFSSILDTAISSVISETALSGQPKVKVVGNNDFRVGYFYWDSPHLGSGSSIDEVDYIYISDLSLNGLSTELDDSPIGVAKDEKQVGGNPPGSFDFYMDSDSNFISYWSGFNNDSVRTSNSAHKGFYSGSLNSFATNATDIPMGNLGGEPAFALMNEVDLADTDTWKVAIAYNLGINDDALAIQVKEPLNGTIYGPDTIASGNAFPPRHIGIKVAPNGTILVSWIKSPLVVGDVLGELYVSAYTDSLTPILGMQSVLVASDVIVHGASFEDNNSNTYGLEAIDDDQFVITYSNVSEVYYNTINVAAKSISPSTLVTPHCAVCFFPSITLTPDSTKLVISYFGNENEAASDTLAQGSFYDLVGAIRSVDNSSRITRTLSTREVNYSHSYGKRIHYYSQVSVAMDNDGNIVAGFNWEDKAWVNGWANVNIYQDTGRYLSKDLIIPSGLVTESYDPLKDSVEWIQAFSVLDSNVDTRFQFSTDGTYNEPFVEIDDLGNFPAPTRASGNHYRYAFELRSSNQARVAPAVDSMLLKWNVRPRDVVIDSIKIGNSPYQSFRSDKIYPVINRLDSVRIELSGFDYDNPVELTLAQYEDTVFVDSVKIVQSVTLLPAGFFRASISYLPRDTVAADLPIIFNWVDPAGWASAKDTLHLNYYNIPPEDSVFITFPQGGGRGDSSEQVVPDKYYRIQMGDTTHLRIVALDSNDAIVNIQLSDTDNWIQSVEQVNVIDSINKLIPHDDIDTLADRELAIPDIDLTIDTVYIVLEDGDVKREIQVLLVPNHVPWIDSIKTLSYMLENGAFKDSTIYHNTNLQIDRSLDIIPFVPNRIVAYDRDPDEINLDSSYVEWYLLEVDSNGACCIDWPSPIGVGDTIVLGGKELYGDSLVIPLGADTLTVIGRDSLISWYEKFHRLRMVTYDVTGAFREDTLGLTYPRLDTNQNNNNFQMDLDSLLESFDLVLGGSSQGKQYKTKVTSTGTSPLVINRSYTGEDQAIWLDYKLDWVDTTGTVSSSFVENRTDSSRITPSAAITLKQFEDLTITFDVNVANLVGDSIIQDTLYLETNDWFNPILKLPLRLEYNDYPKVTVFYEPFDDRDTVYTIDSLVQNIPLNGRLKFAFTEPVVESDIHQYIKVFSVPDNVSRGLDADSLLYEAGELGSRISLTQSKFSSQFQRVYSRDANGNILSKYVDTLLFIPSYKTVSDSFKIRPAPESFVVGDSIHIWMSHSIVDSTGNPLDLAKSALPLAQLTTDTIIPTSIDASTFKVVESKLSPQIGGTQPPGDPIRIPFDSRLVEWNIFGGDSIFSIDFNRKGAGNRTVRISSKKSQWEHVPLKSIQLENNDSTLVIYPRRHFFSKDSLRIQVFSNLSDWKGRTLNGNGDSTFTYLFWCYDTPTRELNELCSQGLGQDTVDQFEWLVEVGESGFYSFPNPYRPYRADHREVGGIAFKNLHKIKGIVPDEPINIRVYTLNGQLVHSSKRKNRSVVFAEGANDAPQYIWNARNNHGKLVATGLYIYVIESSDEVVQKGKVAVIR